MEVKITDLHPTQLYLSEKKLQAIQMLDQSAEIINVDPISVLAFGDSLLITDGHHRAYPVSYTHLDVYKRQQQEFPPINGLVLPMPILVSLKQLFLS